MPEDLEGSETVVLKRLVCLAICSMLWWPWVAGVTHASDTAKTRHRPQAVVTAREFRSLRLAIEDLIETFGSRYRGGRDYLRRLDALRPGAKGRTTADRSGPQAAPKTATQAGDTPTRARFEQLKREALLANPLLDFDTLLVVKRKSMRYVRSAKDEKIWFSKSPGADLGFPSNHECNSSLPREGYDNEIAVLSLKHAAAALATLYRPEADVYVGEMDVHWDADRLLFTQSSRTHWQVWEIRTDGSDLRRVSQMPDDVDSFDACYLPDGRIVFGSTASYQAVPCWHGQKWVSNLYLMNADGSGVRQLCFDQDHDFHPCVLPNGQVLYHRWDYTGISHIFLRQLMVMNPDGTGQRAVYGSNSWFPNSLYFPQPLPGENERLISILSGYHGVHKMGQLVLVDTSKGWYEADGLVRRISGRGDPIQPKVRDNLVDQDWPKFLHLYPLSDKHFLVACWPNAKSSWGIYLADAFDNLVRIRRETGYALFEPVPVMKRPKPRVVSDRVDLGRDDGIVYLHNVYSGAGLAGVPHGTIEKLRVIAYHFGYRHLAGPDKIGCGGPWEVMRILGTVPLERDGSVMFRVPANTPIAVQALDAEGKAVQLMRSWFTVMPGETLSCVGCHERPSEAAPAQLAMAMQRGTRQIEPWRGPARGFDFAREVQPVLNTYCTGCHDGAPGRPDLRPLEQVPDYKGRPLSALGVKRLHPKMARDTGGLVKYTPAYDALIPYLRRVSIEDDVSLLVPGEYHADTSPLIQMMRRGHHGVQLDTEAWDRLVTWIDLNAPCHGTWGEVFPIPDRAHERRMALRAAYGGPRDDPEAIVDVARPATEPVEPRPLPEPTAVPLAGWPFDARRAEAFQRGTGPWQRLVDLGDGVTMTLVRIPAGQFVMGGPSGGPDARPASAVRIDRPFWMGTCEVTNEQFRQFRPDHDCLYYAKRHARSDDRGLPLNVAGQPVVRVSWQQAMAFCRWLSERIGMPFTLPTEAQWEYACRAGTATALHYGEFNADFTGWANVADQSFGDPAKGDYVGLTGGLEHAVLEGSALSDLRFDDGFVVTAPVGHFGPNAWGLHDMHGNAAEWTRTTYAGYPYSDTDGDNDAEAGRRKVVRGGSFFDPPKRCRAAIRLAYPAWQRVFNVGFRVVCEAAEGASPEFAATGEPASH